MRHIMLFVASACALVACAATSHAQVAVGQNAGKLSYYDPDLTPPRVENLETDVCIYGGTSAGVAAALQVSRDGKRAMILEPSAHIGGLSAGGLGETDIGNKAAIGGIAREFYRRIGQKYGENEEWRFEPHVAASVFGDMIAESKTPVYTRQFLRSVQKDGAVIRSITLENGLTVRAKMFIDATYEGDLMAKAGVSYAVGREANATYGETLDGVQVQKYHQFDLSVDPYVVEGDPKSGLLPFIRAGELPPQGSGDDRVQAYCFRLCLTNDPANRIDFEKPANYDPQQYVLLGRYLKAGWPESEAFRKFDPIRNSFNVAQAATATRLSADDLRDAKGLIVKLKKAGGPFTRYLKDAVSPALRAQVDAFDEKQTPSPQLQHALLDELNRLASGALLYTPQLFEKVQLSAATREMLARNPAGDDLARLNTQLLREAYAAELGAPNYQKVDKNNHGAISTDFIGANTAYPEANYATREIIFQAHVTYQKGLMWFMGHDASVPQKIRDRWNTWGLCRDEFVESGGWSHQLYVREARRMVSDYVMTEANCRAEAVANDAIGLAAYTMDSHNVQRFVRDGRVMNEGDVQEKGGLPYPISYRSIVPRKAQCENLLVPVCLSASHIAYGSIRMEPVFMAMGQSAASAADLAIERAVAVQNVPYAELKTRLQAGKQILAWGKANDAPIAALDTDSQAALKAFFANLKAGQEQNVVVYGTSLTASSPGGAWTKTLKDWLETNFPGKTHFFNGGLSGKNSDEGVAQLQTKVLAHQPDLVFIEFSMNDAHKKFEMPIERGAANLDAMVRAIRAGTPNCAIVLQIMDKPWDAPNGNRSASDRPQLEAFNENYRVYARQHVLPIVDHFPDWQRLQTNEPEKYQSFIPDGVHPNVQGNLEINWPPIEALLSNHALPIEFYLKSISFRGIFRTNS